MTSLFLGGGSDGVQEKKKKKRRKKEEEKKSSLNNNNKKIRPEGSSTRTVFPERIDLGQHKVCLRAAVDDYLESTGDHVDG